MRCRLLLSIIVVSVRRSVSLSRSSTRRRVQCVRRHSVQPLSNHFGRLFILFRDLECCICHVKCNYQIFIIAATVNYFFKAQNHLISYTVHYENEVFRFPIWQKTNTIKQKKTNFIFYAKNLCQKLASANICYSYLNIQRGPEKLKPLCFCL